MADKPADRKNAEANNNNGKRQGIRKVNLSDIQGSLSKRGRERYSNPELAEALRNLLATGEAFIWEDAQPEGDTKEKHNASKAKWRNRATSVFETLNSTATVSIQWTTNDEMVISIKA